MPVISTAEMEKLTETPGLMRIDARSVERYQGLQEPIDPVAGHIPGAVNRFHGLNLDASGHFRSPGDLHQAFVSLVGDKDTSDAVVYCGSGVTSCHHVLAMKMAGLPLPRLYAGSWSEWIRDPVRPVIDKSHQPD